jgi:hypothetical protein
MLTRSSSAKEADGSERQEQPRVPVQRQVIDAADVARKHPQVAATLRRIRRI